MDSNVMLQLDNSLHAQESFKVVMTETLALLIPAMQKPTNVSSLELFAKITTCVPLENV
jgi:hypothetical protein